jgi:hypothetical protein
MTHDNFEIVNQALIDRAKGSLQTRNRQQLQNFLLHLVNQMIVIGFIFRFGDDKREIPHK